MVFVIKNNPNRIKRNYQFGVKKKPLVNRVNRLAKKLAQIMPEKKYSDINILSQPFNYDPTSSYIQNLFSSMSQGDSDVNNYTGDEITHKGFVIRGTLYNQSSIPFLAQILLVRVKMNPEGLMTTTNLGNIIKESTYLGTANGLNAPLDHDNRHNFQIIRRWKFTLNPGAGSGTGTTAFPQALQFTKYVKTNFKVGFRAGGNVPSKNGLYLIFLNDTTANGVLNYVLRHSYIDS